MLTDAEIACCGKVAMKRQLAQHVAKRSKRSRKCNKRRIAYQCPSCGHWHVGNSPTRPTLRRERQHEAELEMELMA